MWQRTVSYSTHSATIIVDKLHEGSQRSKLQEVVCRPNLHPTHLAHIPFVPDTTSVNSGPVSGTFRTSETTGHIVGQCSEPGSTTQMLTAALPVAAHP